MLGIPGSDVENLQAAIAGEDYETTTMYPGFAADAARTGDTSSPTCSPRSRPRTRRGTATPTSGRSPISRQASGRSPRRGWPTSTPSTPDGRCPTARNLKNPPSAMHGEGDGLGEVRHVRRDRRQGQQYALPAFCSPRRRRSSSGSTSPRRRSTPGSSVTPPNLKTSAKGENAEATHYVSEHGAPGPRAGDVWRGTCSGRSRSTRRGTATPFSPNSAADVGKAA